MRYLENQLVVEGISGTRNVDDELLGATIGTLRGQADIVADGRRLRKEALKQRQVEQWKDLCLGGTDAIQDNKALSPELEEYIDRGGDLNEEIVEVHGDEEEVKGLDELIPDEVVPD